MAIRDTQLTMWDLVQKIEKFCGNKKFAIAIAVDGFTALVASSLSFLIIDQVRGITSIEILWWVPPAAVPITIAVYYVARVYSTSLRFANASFFIKVIIFSVIVAGLVASLPLAIAYSNQNATGFSRWSFPLFGILLALGACCSRLFARGYFDQLALTTGHPVSRRQWRGCTRPQTFSYLVTLSQW